MNLKIMGTFNQIHLHQLAMNLKIMGRFNQIHLHQLPMNLKIMGRFNQIHLHQLTMNLKMMESRHVIIESGDRVDLKINSLHTVFPSISDPLKRNLDKKLDDKKSTYVVIGYRISFPK